MEYSQFIKTANKDTVKEISKMVREFNINTDELTITICNSLETITTYNLKWGTNYTWLIEPKY